MEYKDHYKILGENKDASQDDIKCAYRKLSRKYHPDVSKEQNVEQQFKEVGEAYEVIKDPPKSAPPTISSVPAGEQVWISGHRQTGSRTSRSTAAGSPQGTLVDSVISSKPCSVVATARSAVLVRDTRVFTCGARIFMPGSAST